MLQAQSLLKVGELGVGIGLTGPDGPAGAGRVMSKTLTVPTDIDIVQVNKGKHKMAGPFGPLG